MESFQYHCIGWYVATSCRNQFADPICSVSARLLKCGCELHIPLCPFYLVYCHPTCSHRGRPYNAHLADVWSVGATIWEVFEGTPPFLDAENSADLGDRWPTLKRNSELSASLHQFLRLCSEADDWRPRADELLEVSGRHIIWRASTDESFSDILCSWCMLTE